MTSMFADLLRGQRRLRRHVRCLTCFLFNDLGKLWLPEVVHFSVLARGERSHHGHGAIRAIRVILLHPFPLRLWGRPAQGWHLRRRGVRMRRDRADQPDRFRTP